MITDKELITHNFLCFSVNSVNQFLAGTEREGEKREKGEEIEERRKEVSPFPLHTFLLLPSSLLHLLCRLLTLIKVINKNPWLCSREHQQPWYMYKLQLHDLTWPNMTFLYPQGKLRNHIHNPNAAELVHYLFVPLSLLVRCTGG